VSSASAVPQASTVPIAANNRGFWGTIPWLMLMVACGHFIREGFSVVGTERIIPQYSLDPDRMGLVYSAFLLCYTLAMIPGGWIIDRYGARSALLLWGIGSVVFVFLTGAVGLVAGTATSVWGLLLVVRSFLGAVNAPLHPASARMVYEHVPPRMRALANGLVTFAACVGIAVTFRILGPLVERFDWPITVIMCSALTLAVTGIFAIFTRPTLAGAGPSHVSHQQPLDWSLLLKVLRHRSVICLTLSYAAQGYFQYVFFYWIEYFFEKVQHQPREVARDYSMWVTLAMGVGMVFGGFLADRVPKRFSPRMRGALVPALAMILSGAVLCAGLLATDPRITLQAIALSAFCIGACEGSFWTTSVGLGGRYGGIVAGLMNCGGNAGGTLSPWVVPLLGGYFGKFYGADTGWRLSLAVASLIVMLGAVLWLGVTPRHDHDEGTAPGPSNAVV